MPPVIGAFSVERLLGRGGMGLVYLAHQAGLSRPVALKVLDPVYSADAEFAARFRNEARILGQLDSLHIVGIHDYGEADGLLYLAMQYVAGGDLGDFVRRNGRLSVSAALAVFSQIMEALRDAHAVGVLHRDVKPSNVLLRADQEEPFVYLADFGIAHEDDTDGLTQTGFVPGSLNFMAPERHLGESATVKTDVYAAACVLWVMLTGHVPFTGTGMQVISGHLSGVVPQLAGDGSDVALVNYLVRWCLAKDPSDRPTAGEVLAFLKRGTVSDVLPGLVVSRLEDQDASSICVSFDESMSKPMPKSVDSADTGSGCGQSVDLVSKEVDSTGVGTAAANEDGSTEGSNPELLSALGSGALLKEDSSDVSPAAGESGLDVKPGGMQEAVGEISVDGEMASELSGLAGLEAGLSEAATILKFARVANSDLDVSGGDTHDEVQSDGVADIESSSLERSRHRRRWLTAVIILLVMGIIGEGGWAYSYWNGSYVGVVDDINRTVVAGQADTPQQAVRGFLLALADSNAEDALKFAVNPPVDRTYLTDAVLKVSNQLRPMSKSVAAAINQDSTRGNIMVDATYWLGSLPVFDTFHIVNKNGYFFLRFVTGTITVPANSVFERINGAAMSVSSQPKNWEVFPGTYQVTIDNPLMAITDGATLLVTQIQSTVVMPTQTFGLAPGAQDVLASLAGDALTKCMAEINTMTTCGFGDVYFTDKKTGKRLDPKPNTARWVFQDDNIFFTGASFGLADQYHASAVALAAISMNLRVYYTITAGEPARWSDYTLTYAVIDFSDANNPQVTFNWVHAT